MKQQRCSLLSFPLSYLSLRTSLFSLVCFSLYSGGSRCGRVRRNSSDNVSGPDRHGKGRYSGSAREAAPYTRVSTQIDTDRKNKKK